MTRVRGGERSGRWTLTPSSVPNQSTPSTSAIAATRGACRPSCSPKTPQSPCSKKETPSRVPIQIRPRASSKSVSTRSLTSPWLRAERRPRLPLAAADPPLRPDPEAVGAVHEQGCHRVGGKAVVRPVPSPGPLLEHPEPPRRPGPEAPPAVDRERRDRTREKTAALLRRVGRAGPLLRLQAAQAPHRADPDPAFGVGGERRHHVVGQARCGYRRRRFFRPPPRPRTARRGRFSPRRRGARAPCRRSAPGRGRSRPRGRPPHLRQNSGPDPRDARAARPSRRRARAAR